MNFFNEASPYLKHPLLTAARTSGEVDQLINVLELQEGDSVLDAGCGFGRHTIELARRGINVMGVDPSATMIEAARAAAVGVNPSITDRVIFEQAQVQDLKDRYSFDAAICMFTSLGQVDEHGTDNRHLLQRVSAVVRAGGDLIVEVPNRPWVQSNLQRRDSFGAAGDRTDVRRKFEEETNRVIEQFDVYTDGHLQQFDLSYYLFDHDELAVTLRDSGFGNVAIYPTLGAASARTELVEFNSSPALIAHATVL